MAGGQDGCLGPAAPVLGLRVGDSNVTLMAAAHASMDTLTNEKYIHCDTSKLWAKLQLIGLHENSLHMHQPGTQKVLNHVSTF